MLEIEVPPNEAWTGEEFINFKGQKLELEHSLVSISKWESKWEKPFIKSGRKDVLTTEEFKDYIRCMTINKNVDPQTYEMLTRDNYQKIGDYINAKMTATNMIDHDKGGRQQITSEVIYCWMITLGIPFECQKWHLNRLLALIKVCNRYNTPDKKMSKKDALSRAAAINAANRAKYHSKG